MKKNKTDLTELNDFSQKKKAFLKIYAESFGNITKTAEAVEISRASYYNWIKEDQEFKKAIRDIEPAEMLIDFVESQLIENIKSGDTTAIIFFLKTKGIRRGYSEKLNIEMTGKEALEINEDLINDLDSLSITELKERLIDYAKVITERKAFVCIVDTKEHKKDFEEAF
jgi:hypothetical protein